MDLLYRCAAVMRISRFLWVSCVILASCGDDESASPPPPDGGDGTGARQATGGRSNTGGSGTGAISTDGGAGGSGGFITGGVGGTGGGPGGFPTGGFTTGGFPTGGFPTGGASGGSDGCDGEGRCPTPPLPEPPGIAYCGGVECPSGQECCLATLQCFDPHARAACPKPPGQSPEGRAACASNSDCKDNEYCNVPVNGLCGGPGVCESREMCPRDASPTPYCGCDGRTYTSRQHACSVGVRAPNPGACGVPTVIGRGGASSGLPITPCARDNDCSGECCEITGTCYKEADAAICKLPPAGTSRPCLSNLDCFRGTEYCWAPTCDGPGGCKPLGGCTDIMVLVCGCDGQPYQNASCAAAKGMRVSPGRECIPDAGL
jgi:hypothetical protein